MSRKGKPRARDQLAGVTETAQITKKVEAPSENPSRPRTRAWLKQQETQARIVDQETTDPQLSRRETLKTPKPPQTQPKRTQRNRLQNTSDDESSPLKKDSRAAPQTVEPQQTKKSRLHGYLAGNPRSKQPRGAPSGQGPNLTRWLEQVEPVAPETSHQLETLYTAPVPGVVYRARENMESSSTSRNTKENESTAKAVGNKGIKLSENKLRLRRVNREPTSDERLAYLQTIVKTDLPERPLRDTGDFQRTLRDFLQLTVDRPDDDCHDHIDDFSHKVDERKSKLGYPVVNKRYFQDDVKRCLAKNEAILQRTIMIHIINHHWMSSIFDWNCEGQWSQPKDTRLPSREDDDVSLPKPDLAISFTLKSFTGEDDDSDPIPAALERCISPDGGSRCFPFLFMEVKKAVADLQEAYMANLHNASQALYNIYQWMVQAEKLEEFFRTVRVFSFVFNAQDLSVRVHRASQLGDGNIAFRFDEFSPVGRYSKDQACLLVHSILHDYAAKDLHPALSAAFVEIVKQEDERVVSKRKTSMRPEVVPSKKPRQSKDDGSHTGQSFAFGSMAT